MNQSKNNMNMKDKYSVSIVMPTYNKKDVVENTIKNYLNKQTYDKSKYELIVVDDGSTDGTYDHLKNKFKKEIEEGRLKILTQRNQGVTTARNLGIKYSKGEYICRADDDDPPLSNRIQDSIDYFKKNSNRRIVHGKSYWLDAKGRKIHNGKNFKKGLNMYRERIAKHSNLAEKTEDILLEEKEGEYFLGKNVVHGGTTLAHRSLYKEIEAKYGHVYDPHLSNSEDKDLWTRIAKHSKDTGKKEFGFINKVLANYVYTKDTEKKEILKKKRHKYIEGYISNKLKGKTKNRLVFAKDDLNDEQLHFYLHKIGKRGFKNGERIVFVIKDPESKKYKARRLDTDIITQKKNKFFKRKMIEYDSLDDLLKSTHKNNIQNIEYVDGIHFHDEHETILQKINVPFKYTILKDFDNKFLKNLSKREFQKIMNLIKNSNEITINNDNNAKIRKLLSKYVTRDKIHEWVKVRV